jgi:hypothetical protein
MQPYDVGFDFWVGNLGYKTHICHDWNERVLPKNVAAGDSFSTLGPIKPTKLQLITVSKERIISPISSSLSKNDIAC